MSRSKSVSWISALAETSSSSSKVAYLSEDTFVTKVVWQSHSPKEFYSAWKPGDNQTTDQEEANMGCL